MIEQTCTKNILFISNSPFISGAEISLFQFIENSNYRRNCILAIPKGFSFPENIQCKICHLPFTWFYKTYNPFKIFKFIFYIFISTIFICRNIKNYNIEVIYTNSTKSLIYGVIAKMFTKRKLIWHVRDNHRTNILNRIILKRCDTIISISKHIYDQFPLDINNNKLVYGGIDPAYWKPENIEKVFNKSIETDKFKIPSGSSKIIIAYIAQITKWKNHEDFIKASNILLDKNYNVQFLIIGDDLSGREENYKKELYNFVNELGISSCFSFLGYENEIKNIISQIDILVHPAINEPFGRVLIEAMAMEKPVVAYNCGGPMEIIENGQTGYLVEPYNYEQLAEKTLELIDNKELRLKMGKEGRQRVVEKFNIERYVREMEVLFDSV